MEIISLLLLGLNSIFWNVLVITLIIGFILIIFISGQDNISLFDYFLGILIMIPVFIVLMIAELIFWLLLFHFELPIIGIGIGLIFGVVIKLATDSYDPGHSPSRTHIWIREDIYGRKSVAGPASEKDVFMHYNDPILWEEDVVKTRIFFRYLVYVISCIVLWILYGNVELLAGMIFGYISLNFLLGKLFADMTQNERYNNLIATPVGIFLVIIYLISIIRIILFIIQSI